MTDASAIRELRFSKALAWLAGFVLTANFSLAPWLENAPRLHDLFCVALALVTLGAVLRRPIYTQAIWLFGMVYFFVLYGVWGIAIADSSLAIAAGRFATVLVALPTLTAILRRDGAFSAFLLGGALGANLVGLIALGQLLEWGPWFKSVIPAGTPTWWGLNGQIRAVGLYQHPNGLSQVQIVGAAMAATLIWVPKRRLIGYGLFGLIVWLTYYVTQTRTGLVAAALTLIIIHGLHPERRTRFLSILAGWPLFFFAIFIGPDFLGERWTGSTAQGMSLWDNLAARAGTNLNTLTSILTEPLGLGVAGRIEHLAQIGDGVSASHNGFLSFGLTFGLVPFLVLTISVARRLFASQVDLFYPLTAVVSLQLLAEDALFSTSTQMALFLGLVGFRRFFAEPKSLRNAAQLPNRGAPPPARPAIILPSLPAPLPPRRPM